MQDPIESNVNVIEVKENLSDRLSLEEDNRSGLEKGIAKVCFNHFNCVYSWMLDMPFMCFTER